MKLSAIISDFRKRINISQREFARRCNLSNSYISFIENDVNPRTGKPMTPTIEKYKKLADGMDMTLHQLFEILDDDSPVDLTADESDPYFSEPPTVPDGLSEDERRLLDAWRAADDRAREDALKTLLGHPRESAKL